MGMDKMAIARRKCARGAVLTLLFGNPRAAVMRYVKVYLGDEVLSLVQDPPREALVRLTAKGIDLMEGTLDDEGVAFGDPMRQ